MNIKKLLALLTIILFLSTQADAMRYNWKSTKDAKQSVQKAAACAPATELVLLQYNNVRALIETGGNMWQDRATSRAFYRVPAEGNVSVIFAGALWLGGISDDLQLKLAAVTFRADGNDFWPGPLTLNGTAEIDEATCEEYDRFFVTERQWAEQHRAYYDCLNNQGGCEVSDLFPEGYVTPSEFYDYPAEGNTDKFQDQYLAPFFDYNDDGKYFPDDGDYPWYDLTGDVDCNNKSREDVVPLFGDQNIWYIFNDKGNVHSETNGEPIGMEIRTQAFAFTTNDEINNMTFYNYTLINRGTTNLNNTYFGQWVDADLGSGDDDYVGCDVQRGLGYCYNGDANDESSNTSPGYGANPPAVGIDFFEGPYQDYDGLDNAGPESTLTPISYDDALSTDGIPYKGLGIGYGDEIVDNERYGMRKFLYYNNSQAANGDPDTALEHYNYMIGLWKNGLPMTYGGDGFTSGNDPSQLSDFMFPDDTDVVGFGTEGNIREPWNELTAGNEPEDRRFIQSAGPFSLAPGDYNNITVGVVYARALTGNQFESVELLRQADDKAQALFDNCFEIVAGPDAPDVTIQELDEEIILYLTNNNTISNNYLEQYGNNDQGFDASIPESDSNGDPLSDEDRTYKFQGYQVYQLANDEVTINDLDDLDNSRLIKTLDLQDDITTLVNWDLDQESGEVAPTLEAAGENSGIEHSISIIEDAFSTGNGELINYKTYYFMVVAYGYNNYEDYNSQTKTGQAEVYKSSRKGASAAVQVKSTIPHPVTSESNGTLLSAGYGDGIALTRLEGKGNGTNILDLNPATENQIISSSPWKVSETKYLAGGSPVNVKVIDPLGLKDAEFKLSLGSDNPQRVDTASWRLININTNDTTYSSASIDVLNEQLILDYGISITWNQYVNPTPTFTNYREPLEATLEFTNSNEPWLTGFPDTDGFSEFNWIRSGASITEDAAASPNEQPFDDYEDIDNDEEYESLLSGTVAPYVLASFSSDTDAGVGTLINVAPTVESIKGSISAYAEESSPNANNLTRLNNVDIVFTSDKSLWTRCPVLEMQWNNNLAQTQFVNGYTYISDGSKMRTRRHLSVDKNGLYAGQPSFNSFDGNRNGEQPEGMGWFPGYAVDLDTGERLNMAFGEDSWLGSENGRDMIWNPTGTFASNGTVYKGGQHWGYVFRNAEESNDEGTLIPGYDKGQYLYDRLVDPSFQSSDLIQIYAGCSWVFSAMLTPGFELNSVEDGIIPNDARMRLRVAKDYQKFSPSGQDEENEAAQDAALNFFNPEYTFETSTIATKSAQLDVLEDALADIGVVPNPYYAFSTYENNKLDNRVKIINLPFECEVSIYNLSGTLIRQYKKADPITYLDWDLKNNVNIPIASGVYLIHVKTDAGEKILKWFGVLRPVDLDNF